MHWRCAVPLCWALLAGAQQTVPLTSPTVLHASDGTHDLRIGHVAFGDFGFDTRGFNGNIPGPTFRVKPGETLRITLHNDLLSANNADCSTVAGEFCETATTNLHTHGLHVSSWGTNDGLSEASDDVFETLLPGTSAPYAFVIPDFHMGGTHWYHPHHHHATALQAGGGAAGVLIVDDPAGYLPSDYASMEEKILFISGHNLVLLQEMAISANSGILETAADDATAAGFDTNVFFVNGLLGPTMDISSHVWYRFRMVYAAVEQRLELSVQGDGTCQLELLAKDGVYLHSIPRTISTVYLYPGARADVAVSCTCAAYPCTAQLSSGARRRLQGPGGMGGGGPGPGAPGADVATVTVMDLSISETAGGTTTTLPVTTLQRPCYLVDLQSVTVPNANQGVLNLNGGGRVVQWDGVGTSMTYDNVHAGGDTMLDWDPLTTFQVGTVYELDVTGAAAHPLHIHVQPYQISDMNPADPTGDGYFAVGDWHDTLMIDGGNTLRVRMQTDTFTGKMVVHCHILEHEDEGMMAFISLTGTEGAIYTNAETLDSTCYRTNIDDGSGDDNATTTSTTSTTSTSSSSSSSNDVGISDDTGTATTPTASDGSSDDTSTATPTTSSSSGSSNDGSSGFSEASSASGALTSNFSWVALLVCAFFAFAGRPHT